MGVEIRRGIEYARHDGVALLGDLYAPGEAGKYPVLVAVHGGGWQLGTRDSYRYWALGGGARLYAVRHRLPVKKARPAQLTRPNSY